MIEREELIGGPPAAPVGTPTAAPMTAPAKSRGYRVVAARAAKETLFFAHCASTSQTLRMTRGKDLKQTSLDMRVVRVAVAEFLATAILVGVGCAGCTNALSHDKGNFSSFTSALGFGLTVGILVQVFGHISGAHLNPAVTICAAILQAIEAKMMLVYIPAQVLGATAGFGILRLVTPLSIILEDSHHENGFCTTVPNAELSLSDAFCSEFVATALLILLVCASWDSKNPNCQNLPTQFALGITGIGMIFGPRSGSSMNPARSFGPAVWNGVWTSHWLYWLAPILSAILTTTLYKTVFGFGQLEKEEEIDTNEMEDLGITNNHSEA
ncbi:aquaporin-4-like isoform X2 [Neocloeon triangulifer]|nr:aquaporin-4-like isoform X2 [Neocloeon triangulifer]